MANQNTPSVPEQEQDSNTLRQIRLEKLRQRQADGNDPFTITKYDVTAKAASVKADYEVTEAKFKEEAGDDEEALQAKLDTPERTADLHCRTYYELAGYGTCKLH